MPQPASQNIFLIGPMGSGKTAVGKQLARLLNAPFIDTDSEIEHRTGADITLIFEKEGEAGFRQRELEVIDDLTQRSPVVLSTGGGAILLPQNRERLRERGMVVYLKASIATQTARVRAGQNRPLLAGGNPAEKLAALMAARAPLYASTAHLTVSTDARRILPVAEEIIRGLRAQGLLAPAAF